jgi:hypothetical protein
MSAIRTSGAERGAGDRPRDPLTVSIDGQRFVFHKSRGSQVKQSFSNAKKVIARFNETQSYVPQDYKGTTHSASYLLTLIALALGETPGDGTPRHRACRLDTVR